MCQMASLTIESKTLKNEWVFFYLTMVTQFISQIPSTSMILFFSLLTSCTTGCVKH